MLKSLSLLTFAAALVKAQTPEDIENYPDYAEKFAEGPNGGVTWEPIKIKNDLGYTLTMFHMTGTVDNGPFNVTKNAVIMQHPLGSTGINWLNGLNPNTVPMAY